MADLECQEALDMIVRNGSFAVAKNCSWLCSSMIFTSRKLLSINPGGWVPSKYALLAGLGLAFPLGMDDSPSFDFSCTCKSSISSLSRR